MKTVPIFQETVLLHSGISHSAQTQITCNRPQLQAVTSRLIRVLCWRSRRTVFLPLLQKRRLTVVSDSVAFMPTWVMGKAQYRLTFPTVHFTVSASKDVCVSDGESFHRSHLHWFNWSRVKEHFSVFSLFWLYYMLGLEDVDQNINGPHPHLINPHILNGNLTLKNWPVVTVEKLHDSFHIVYQNTSIHILKTRYITQPRPAEQSCFSAAAYFSLHPPSFTVG